MIDLHSHMLPELDDGAANWEESLGMARLAVEDGIRAVVCTPHWSVGVYENSRTVILEKIALFQTKLQAHKIPLEIYPGSELRLDASLPRKIKSREVLTLNDKGLHALIELPGIILSEHVNRFLWELCSHDITPILGHPERNFLLQRQPAKLAAWIEMGVLVQVTGGSLLGQFGRSARDFALKLMQHRMVHIVSTDAHGILRRSPELSAARRLVEQILGEELANRLTYETPKRILHGEAVKAEAPLPLSSRPSGWKSLFSFWK